MSTPSHLLDAQGTLGALFIGLLVSCVLFGIVTHQAYLYYMDFPEDGLRLKALVAFICFCELGHCICICHATYYKVITVFGNPAFLKVGMPVTLSIAVALGEIIGSVVQIFFAERVRVMSGGKLVIPVFCWTISILALIISVVGCVKAVRPATFWTQWKWLLTTVLSLSVAVDVVISASLCYYLSKGKDMLMKRTAQMINKLMLWTIRSPFFASENQTFLLTSVASVTVIILFMTMPNNFFWLAIYVSLARLFSNSLLASLNARTMLRTMNNDNVQIVFNISTL